jgi:hypothetical protein
VKYYWVFYAGLKLNSKKNTVDLLPEKDMYVSTEANMETPDLSRIARVSDFHSIGLKDIGVTRVKQAWMRNGKMNLVLHSQVIGRKLSNFSVANLS